MLKNIIMATILSSLALSSLADTESRAEEIRVITLESRPASQILLLVSPFLEGGEKIQAQGNSLILQANLRRLDILEGLVEQLDTHPRNIRISVRQGTRQSGGHHGTGYEGKPAQALPEVNQYHSHDRDHLNQQVLTLEGSPAYIESGQRLPFLHYYESGGAYHDSGVSVGIEYQEVHSGFYALANVIQENAEVLMSPYKENLSRHDGGAIDTSAMTSRLVVPLGVWTEIGGGFQRQTTTDEGYFYSTQERNDSNHSIMIKVEIIE